jgi:hypothetical protein
MNKENFDRAFQIFQRRKPWRPFTLELLTGSRIEIEHPEALTRYEDLVKHQSSTGLQSVFEYTSVVRFLAATGTS